MVRNLIVFCTKRYKVDKNEIHKIVSILKKELNFQISSTEINFITSEEILSINKSYLKHDYSTDIITFNYSGENYTLDAEIFISLNDALENAKKYKVSIDKEVLRLVIHGFLHLVGFDDKKESDKKKMKKEENKLVTKYCKLFNKLVLVYDGKNC